MTTTCLVRSARAPFLLWVLCAITLLCCAVGETRAQSKNLAAGFQALPKSARVVVMPTDIELFLISAGGIAEPRADWTEAANRHFRAALTKKKQSLGVAVVDLSEREAEQFDELSSLHAAIASSISLHHFGPSVLNLPTKNGKLDWSLGESVRAIKEKTGADYALFSFIRDSYASGERIAATIFLALFGIAMAPGGLQQGYASLVDLDTGQVMWFNRLFRTTGDLREAEKAADTLNVLLENFPASK